MVASALLCAPSFISGISDAEGRVALGPLPVTDADVRVSAMHHVFDIAATPDPDWPGFRGLNLKPGQTRELPDLVVTPTGAE